MKQINTNLCGKFSVSRYPMLLWGPPPKFLAGGFDPKQNKDEIQLIDEWRTADDLLNYINKRLGRQVALIFSCYMTCFFICYMMKMLSPLNQLFCKPRKRYILKATDYHNRDLS